MEVPDLHFAMPRYLVFLSRFHGVARPSGAKSGAGGVWSSDVPNYAGFPDNGSTIFLLGRGYRELEEYQSMKYACCHERNNTSGRPNNKATTPRGRNRRELFKTASLLGGIIAVASMCGPADAAIGAVKESTVSPSVPIPEVSIRMRCPNSALFGITRDEIIEITLAEVIKFHGYCAGGGTFAFRVAQEAFAALYGKHPAQRGEIIVHTSHHCCQAGALAYITGARTNFGAYGSHGSLVLIPEEDKKIIFMDKPSGKAVTVRPLFNPHDTFAPLFQKARKDPGFALTVQKTLNEKIQEYLTAPVEKLFILQNG
jgi:formylmethanofuran dehydrogenase subunit E